MEQNQFNAYKRQLLEWEKEGTISHGRDFDHDTLHLAKDKCNLRDKAYKFNDCLYKGYQRRGRKDWMSMVKLQDVLNGCEHWFLPHPIRLD